MLNYGKQIGCMVYGGGLNIRAAAGALRQKGYVVIFRDGYATIHLAP